MLTRPQYLESLTDTVAHFLEFFEEPHNAVVKVYPDWTAGDVLAHVTFWHESFARNVDDLVHERIPKPLKGRFVDLNQRGVEALRASSLEEVIGRFKNAHAVIREHILDERLTVIPYRVGSRAYTPEEHLDIVAKHVREHACDVFKALRQEGG